MADSQDKLDQRLWEYLDDALEAKPRLALERELQSNPALRQRLEKLSVLRGALADLPKASAPANFAQRVLEQAERHGLLEDSEHHQHERFGWLSKLATAAAVVLVIGLGAVIFHMLHRSSYMDRIAQHESKYRPPMEWPAATAPASAPEVALAERTKKPELAKELARVESTLSAAPAALAEKAATSTNAIADVAVAGAALKSSPAQDDESEPPVLIVTSDPRETQRDVEQVLYANAFASGHKLAMNSYVIEQAGSSQLIRVRGDSQQVQNVVSQLAGLAQANQQARGGQSRGAAAAPAMPGPTATPTASNAIERPMPRVMVQQAQTDGRLIVVNTPRRTEKDMKQTSAPSTVPASQPMAMAASAPVVTTASPTPATTSQAARQLVITIQPEEQ